eukprot:scaffold19179_cov35-Tisochrysis_lutea.AAC.1
MASSSSLNGVSRAASIALHARRSPLARIWKGSGGPAATSRSTSRPRTQSSKMGGCIALGTRRMSGKTSSSVEGRAGSCDSSSSGSCERMAAAFFLPNRCMVWKMAETSYPATHFRQYAPPGWRSAHSATLYHLPSTRRTSALLWLCPPCSESSARLALVVR